MRLGALRRFRPRRDVGSAPWHYILGSVGAALLGAEDRDERKWLPEVRADRQLALERSQRASLPEAVHGEWAGIRGRTARGVDQAAYRNGHDLAAARHHRADRGTERRSGRGGAVPVLGVR